MNSSSNAAYRDYVPYKISAIYIICCTILTVILCTAYLVKFPKKTYYQSSFRVLLKCYFCTFIIRAILVVEFQTRSILLYMTADPCDFKISMVECFLIRHPAYTLLLFISFLQLAMAMERVALHYRLDENYNVGIFLIVFALICAEVVNLNLQWVFPLDSTVAYCGRTVMFRTFEQYDANQIFNSLCLVTEIFSLAIILCLHYKQRRIERHESRYEISLSEKFTTQQNRNVLKGILPLFLLHSTFSILSHAAEFVIGMHQREISSVLFAALHGYTNLTHVFAVIAPIVLWRAQSKKSTKILDKAATQEEYFKTYSKAW